MSKINLIVPVPFIQKRNRNIIQAYKKGYSQYKIAKVLDISQPAVAGVIKRNKLEVVL